MSSSFHFASENFVGPIELLLQLVRKRRLHINEVGLAAVADSFLEHFRSMPNMSLHHATHFLNVAATLVYVKSKALFPEVEADDEAEGALVQLVDRVKLYALIQEQLPKIGANSPRSFLTRKPVIKVSTGYVPEVTLSAYVLSQKIKPLLETAKEVSQTIKKEVIRTIRPRMALASIVEAIKDRLTRPGTRLRLSDIVDTLGFSGSSVGQEEGHDPRDAPIGGFLAALEMIKQKDARCEQVGVFSEIIITRLDS